MFPYGRAESGSAAAAGRGAGSGVTVGRYRTARRTPYWMRRSASRIPIASSSWREMLSAAWVMATTWFVPGTDPRARSTAALTASRPMPRPQRSGSSRQETSVPSRADHGSMVTSPSSSFVWRLVTARAPGGTGQPGSPNRDLRPCHGAAQIAVHSLVSPQTLGGVQVLRGDKPERQPGRAHGRGPPAHPRRDTESLIPRSFPATDPQGVGDAAPGQFADGRRQSPERTGDALRRHVKVDLFRKPAGHRGDYP
jgi:hypothetical protein